MGNRKPPARSPVERIELVTKLVAAVFAVLYVIGLVAVNLYLSNVGFAAFSYVRPQYVFTGAWVIFLFSISCLPAYLGLDFLINQSRAARSSSHYFKEFRQQLLRRLLLVVGSLLLVCIAPAVWYAVSKYTTEFESVFPYALPAPLTAVVTLFVCGAGGLGFQELIEYAVQNTDEAPEQEDKTSGDSKTGLRKTLDPAGGILALIMGFLFFNFFLRRIFSD